MLIRDAADSHLLQVVDAKERCAVAAVMDIRL